MRGRNIKRVAHWVVMCFVLLFPIVMTIISGFGNNDISYINEWINEFINLDVNLWYKSLLDTIGIGITENSVMSVMYVYPLYVIWVYILDLLCDIFLCIVKLGHNALERLGADKDLYQTLTGKLIKSLIHSLI